MTASKTNARRFAIAAVLLSGLATACTAVVVDDGRPRPPRPGGGPGPQICTREYAPVCGRRGREEMTFGNACQADAAGYRVVDRGECSRGDGRPQICTREYDPVCARRGRDRMTFGNSCEAEAAGYRVIRGGRCG